MDAFNFLNTLTDFAAVCYSEEIKILALPTFEDRAGVPGRVDGLVYFNQQENQIAGSVAGKSRARYLRLVDYLEIPLQCSQRAIKREQNLVDFAEDVLLILG